MGDINNSVLSCSREESQKVSKGSSSKGFFFFFYFREMILVDEYEGGKTLRLESLQMLML